MDIKKSWLFSRPIAHRGLHGIDAPENSLAAFGKAIEAGFPIEIDVRPIDDGTVVVFHDDKLTRMTDLDGYVCNMTKSDLEKVRLRNSDERIPTFKEELEFVDDKSKKPVKLYDAGISSIEIERRFDNVIYRMGFAGSRRECRQLVLHGHFRVNGKKANIPSMLLKVGDVITLREESRKSAYREQFCFCGLSQVA
mgnify:CR=1 FL=1